MNRSYIQLWDSDYDINSGVHLKTINEAISSSDIVVDQIHGCQYRIHILENYEVDTYQSIYKKAIVIIENSISLIGEINDVTKGEIDKELWFESNDNFYKLIEHMPAVLLKLIDAHGFILNLEYGGHKSNLANVVLSHEFMHLILKNKVVFHNIGVQKADRCNTTENNLPRLSKHEKRLLKNKAKNLSKNKR